MKTVIVLGLVATGGLIATAFPPAPYHTIFGMARNQWGDPLDLRTAKIILEGTNGALMTTSLFPSSDPGVNYSFQVSMDSGTAADLYKPSALKPLYPFRLKIKIGSVSYLPIEMAGSFSMIGRPGLSTRIDLTLGEDSDGDGLPDAWELALIDAAGGGLTLADVHPGDDFDGDGISNLNEYLAGTYAFDPADGFVLTQTAPNRMSFLAIRNRSYTLESSLNLTQWTPVQFRVVGSTNGAFASTYIATDVRIVEVEAAPAGNAHRYFRARVQ